MHSILVRDYMDTNPHILLNDASVKDAVVFLLKGAISGAPVVDKNGKLVGYVSEQDCLSEALNQAFYREEPPNVASVMVKEVATASPDMSIVELAQLMRTTAPRNYPVESEGKLIGMITRSRILEALIEFNQA
jgi:CBS domain-containing protein